jgi:hypothetical protein
LWLAHRGPAAFLIEGRPRRWLRRAGRPRAHRTDDLFLVAIAGLDAEQAARRALSAEGIDEGRLLSLVRVGGDGPPRHR